MDARSFLKPAIFNALFILAVPMAIAEDFPGIKKLMTDTQFKAAGLEKLSHAEIEALNAWLISYTANDSVVIKRTSETVKKESDKIIQSSILGEFKGLQGATKLKLENGHVWQQRMKGQWKTSIHNPKVTIKKNIFGFYMMKIEESGKQIGVKRIQ